MARSWFESISLYAPESLGHLHLLGSCSLPLMHDSRESFIDIRVMGWPDSVRRLAMTAAGASWDRQVPAFLMLRGFPPALGSRNWLKRLMQ
eukprot:6455450-Amphidinium_carterae.2